MPDTYQVQAMEAQNSTRGKALEVLSMRYASEDVLNKRMEFDGTVAGAAGNHCGRSER